MKLAELIRRALVLAPHVRLDAAETPAQVMRAAIVETAPIVGHGRFARRDDAHEKRLDGASDDFIAGYFAALEELVPKVRAAEQRADAAWRTAQTRADSAAAYAPSVPSDGRSIRAGWSPWDLRHR